MKVAPYGSWASPITSELLVRGSVRLLEIKVDGDDVYWIESRPTEAGRYVIVRRTPDGRTQDINPAPFNARTRVHEYGGGAFHVDNGTVYFANYADQRVYRQDPGGAPRPITPDLPLRYADFNSDRRRGRLICVREDHRGAHGPEQDAVNTIVALDSDGGDLETGGTVLLSGADFYSNPRVSPDGTRLCWLSWNHPNMPWDGTELWVGTIASDGSISDARLVAGGENESIFQPEWSPDGILYFVSDRSGWWNLYRWREEQIEALAPMEAEFGEPQWVFGQSTYAFASPTRIICAYTQGGRWYIGDLDLTGPTLRTIPAPWTLVDLIQTGPGFVVFRAATPTEPTAIVRHDLATGQTEVLRRSATVEIDSGYISVPGTIEFPTEGGLTAYGFFYPPKNKDFTGPEGELPPLVVISHGGPTGSSSAAFSLQTQYWTSRGFAILDVNYGGSTGYGRAYRERLNGKWGIVDVDDCVNGARYLAEEGLVDGNRLAIRGWSASGYTTLAALTFRSVFKAGASHYGISDLEAMVRDTHKFESRYLDRLVAPYPEGRDVYLERSPIHFVDRLSCPLILFQGLEDKVVPPNQAQMMYEAVKAKGLPVALVLFEGEQHGFRKAENIRRALDGEWYFLSRVFGFELPEPIEPVEIENLPS
ncbi:MAG TPA: S9 family peptidase [Thermomicrobiales bacterium]